MDICAAPLLCSIFGGWGRLSTQDFDTLGRNRRLNLDLSSRNLWSRSRTKRIFLKLLCIGCHDFAENWSNCNHCRTVFWRSHIFEFWGLALASNVSGRPSFSRMGSPSYFAPIPWQNHLCWWLVCAHFAGRKWWSPWNWPSSNQVWLSHPYSNPSLSWNASSQSSLQSLIFPAEDFLSGRFRSMHLFVLHWTCQDARSMFDVWGWRLQRFLLVYLWSSLGSATRT